MNESRARNVFWHGCVCALFREEKQLSNILGHNENLKSKTYSFYSFLVEILGVKVRTEITGEFLEFQKKLVGKARESEKLNEDFKEVAS